MHSLPSTGPAPRRGKAARAASWCFAALAAGAAACAHASTGEWRIGAGESVVGAHEVYVARYEDTLLDVARRFGLGIEEIKLANPGVDLWLPGEGTPVRLPRQFVLPEAPRVGLVLNVAEMRMYLYGEGGSLVRTWPVSIGRVGWETPLGRTTIVRKAKRPTWYPPASIRAEHLERGEILPPVVRPGPDNPLGSHALYLGLPSYLIHGTNRPYSIGMRVSHGCVRLYPEHIAEVYALTGKGTRVTLVDQRVKAGWHGNELFVEVHPTAGVSPEEARAKMAEAVDAISRAMPEGWMKSDVGIDIDWALVKAALTAGNGVPVAVGVKGIDTAIGPHSADSRPKS